MTCERCGTTLTGPTQIRYCSRLCLRRTNATNRAAAAAKARADLIEDIADLLEHGANPADVLNRVGSSPRAIEHVLYREGRHDLARVLAPSINATRFHDCPDCGTPGVAHSAKRCRPCAIRAKGAAA